ncbi:hypothetical protein PIIN_00710 [Serendipita indica DSM 11827]|uniref:Zn(2)-C6 fungal-type domain-containing protein n=1 Tax=Serendipita indica (strain DSM 11827) TaxID=1109443 RepID=G4U2Y0_SERID|nr:hypothetical protein PIIN_00710 [Serendipita indica DSM 11827]
MPAAHTLAHACAECKRLKLKCDKNQPCGACIRRGCPQICPDGQLVAGKGTRFILSNTKELHEEIDSLRKRVRELETALSELQSQVTPEPHPLLQQSLKLVSEKLAPVDSAVKVEPEDESLIDTFGTLTLEANGQTVWYGPHAGSEFFIPRGDPLPSSIEAPSPLPVDLMILSKTFPFKTVTQIEAEEIIRKEIRSHLPAENVAYDSCYTYHSRLAWSTLPNIWDEFLETVFRPVYTVGGSPDDQQVGLLFLVMAISVIMDPKQPLNHPDASRFYHLSKISMGLGEDIFQSRSLLTIQYLQLLAVFYGVQGDPSGPNKSWLATSIAIRLAQMAGLHRDNPQWRLNPAEAEKRRRTWWELISFETAQAFAMGRPRAINVAHFDAKMPHDPEDDGKRPSFNRIKFRWIATGLGTILDEAFAVKPPSYARILKIDKEIRDWPLDSVPAVDDLQMQLPEETNRKFMVILMRSFATTGLREIVLMYMHRRYFVEALSRFPNEPLRSKYAMSVLAVHRSAVLLLQGIQRLDSLIGQFLPRIFFIWLHGLSAYICLCALVIKSPGCSLAKSCIVEIDRTKDLFARVTSYRLAHAQPIISKLYDQAHLAMAMHNEGKWPVDARDCSSADGDVDVMRFAGRPGFISRTEPGRERESQDNTSANTPDTGSGGSPPNVAHHLLTEYMKRFQGESDSEDGDTSSRAGSSHLLGFPPEQTMFPPLMGGDLTCDIQPNGPLTPNDMFPSLHRPPSTTSSSNMVNSATPSFGQFSPEKSGMFEWLGGAAAPFQGQIDPTTLASAPSLPYFNMPYGFDGMAQFDGTAQTTSDEAWEAFLTGLQVVPTANVQF